ncbi:MAG: aspartate carbamoyltransferase catalytic subunit [Phycisphaerales bacterium]|nr:aspartate carbamoyltransferase catalytic subunit [Phycisphaerales bacterium]
MWNGHHLISMENADASQARALLSLAHHDDFDPATLAGRSVANLFFEDSTRTRVSFSLAAQQLGAHVLDLTSKGSSLSKGETLLDTAWTVEAMGVDALVIRFGESSACRQIAEQVKIPVINAGDGKNQHPTQALADALTIGRSLKCNTDWDFSGLCVAIVGDVVSSRVAGSNIGLLNALGASVVVIGPEAMAPDSMSSTGREVVHDLDAVVDQVDVMMMLRIQFERGGGEGLASKDQYHQSFGLTKARADRMKQDAIVMHPGPMNRGVEIAGEVADGDRSVILDQVKHGVLVRKAALATAIASD